ncbi:MAG: GNAT family N-acetyltransferase [Bdellovibrionales bacterium]
MSEIQHKEGEFFITSGSEKSKLTYTLSEGVMNASHTFVPESMRGRGIAKKLVLELVSYAKANNYQIDPVCSYVQKFFEENKEYKDLVV